ncbi:hypothetical protein IW261DRAFT_1423958 [Armillaria novae-zelandiae]|uniref:Transmembrane protein n=1 Tax=Armillaria novae-zelandiae TaxID=153914 RepID=A0AA39NWQ3_9AGAR|nr:hypothetical protein IW261DRAFT_1423958 [Armillaria novae-zelandiae]
MKFVEWIIPCTSKLNRKNPGRRSILKPERMEGSLDDPDNDRPIRLLWISSPAVGDGDDYPMPPQLWPDIGYQNISCARQHILSREEWQQQMHQKEGEPAKWRMRREPLATSARVMVVLDVQIKGVSRNHCQHSLRVGRVRKDGKVNATSFSSAKQRGTADLSHRSTVLVFETLPPLVTVRCISSEFAVRIRDSPANLTLSFCICDLDNLWETRMLLTARQFQTPQAAEPTSFDLDANATRLCLPPILASSSSSSNFFSESNTAAFTFRCFLFSLAFVIVIPILCIVLGKTLHPAEFAYTDLDTDNDETRKIYLHADLTSADLKQRTMVLDWSIIYDTCNSMSTNCSSVNIYFDTNLLRRSVTNNSDPSNNNRPVVPTFIWNVTADDQDYYLANSPRFQTELSVFPQYKVGVDHQIKYTLSSDVYYPFDRYVAGVLAFAEGVRTNESVRLILDSTAGLVEGLKISAIVPSASTLGHENILNVIELELVVERGKLIKIYCVVITIAFWLITIMICLVMVMTVAFGFQQRNEIVVVPIGTVFAFTQLRLTMPGAPDGFDFVGVLPCLVLLSISAVAMVGIYIFTDPAQDSREKLTWSALGEPVLQFPRGVMLTCSFTVHTLTYQVRAILERVETSNTPTESYSMVPPPPLENAD